MDKRIILFGTILPLVMVIAVAYIKFVIYDGKTDIAFYIKWIPSFLLCVQSIILAYSYKFVCNDKHMYFYCLFLIAAYICCIVADVLLIFVTMPLFMTGMLMFLFVHSLFGMGRIYHIKEYIRYDDNKFIIILGIIFIIIAQIFYIVNIIILVLQNDNIDSVPFIIFICIHSCFIIFSILCNYIYLVSFQTLRALFSFIGVTMCCISNCILFFHKIKYSHKYLEVFALVLYWCGLTVISLAAYRTETIDYIILNDDY